MKTCLFLIFGFFSVTASTWAADVFEDVDQKKVGQSVIEIQTRVSPETSKEEVSFRACVISQLAPLQYACPSQFLGSSQWHDRAGLTEKFDAALKSFIMRGTLTVGVGAAVAVLALYLLPEEGMAAILAKIGLSLPALMVYGVGAGMYNDEFINASAYITAATVGITAGLVAQKKALLDEYSKALMFRKNVLDDVNVSAGPGVNVADLVLVLQVL